MENNTIQSWIGKNVRIKKEFIELSEPEIDEDASDYDDEGNIINEVYYEQRYFINTQNGLDNVLRDRDILNDTFYVQYDCYGVDLWHMRMEGKNISELPEPARLIVIRETNYPYLWDAKYFEVVNP
jgi:hypothetical protein